MIDVVFKSFIDEMAKIAMESGPMVPHYAPPIPQTKSRVLPLAAGAAGLAGLGVAAYGGHKLVSGLTSKKGQKALGKMWAGAKENRAKGAVAYAREKAKKAAGKAAKKQAIQTWKRNNPKP